MTDNKPQWGVRQSYGFLPCEIVSESEQMVTYLDGAHKRRAYKIDSARLSGFSSGGFLPWRGSEEEARLLAGRLDSVFDERRRRRDASDDYAKAEAAKLLGVQP